MKIGWWLVLVAVAQLTWGNAVYAAPKSRAKGTIGVIESRADKALKGYLDIKQEGWSPNGDYVVVLATESLRQWSPDDRALSSSPNRFQRVIDVWKREGASYSRIRRLSAKLGTDTSVPPNRLDVSDDGKYAVAFTRLRTNRAVLHLQVWNVAEGRLLPRYQLETPQIREVAFDGYHLILRRQPGNEVSLNLRILDGHRPTLPGI